MPATPAESSAFLALAWARQAGTSSAMACFYRDATRPNRWPHADAKAARLADKAADDERREAWRYYRAYLASQS